MADESSSRDCEDSTRKSRMENNELLKQQKEMVRSWFPSHLLVALWTLTIILLNCCLAIQSDRVEEIGWGHEQQETQKGDIWSLLQFIDYQCYWLPMASNYFVSAFTYYRWESCKMSWGIWSSSSGLLLSNDKPNVELFHVSQSLPTEPRTRFPYPTWRRTSKPEA